MKGRPPLGPLAKDHTIKFRVKRDVAVDLARLASTVGTSQAETARYIFDLGVRAYRKGER